jgi:hypothetical protein
MAYELLPSQDEGLLFFRLEDEAAFRYGAIGYMRADFGRSGKEFWTTWYDGQKHLKTHMFKTEFHEIIDSLRNDGNKPPFADRKNLAAFCAANPGKELTVRGGGYTVRTTDYSYYFRCRPSNEDYDIHVFAYDNRYLLPELAGKNEMPNNCYSVLPSTGELVSLMYGEKGHHPLAQSTPDRAMNRQIASANNMLLGVTRGQEEAMLAGSIYGWSVPAARPWNYEPDGTPRVRPKKKDEPER